MALTSHLRLVLAALAIILSQASAIQNSNFNVSKEYAEAHGCGHRCQEMLEVTNQADLGNIGEDFDFGFYATATNFSREHTQPGDILKLQALDPMPLDILSGTTVYRIQYASKDIDGSVTPVTGFIAFPFTPHFPHARLNGRSSSSAYRLAAFAHGTTGLFPGCATSNGAALYDYNTWQAALSRGYAIVATDYAGLGNNYTTHKYLSLPAQVNDLYYSVVAARKLFGERLTQEWVSFGHSQGGGTVWKLAESDYVKHDRNYLGTISLAPAAYVVDIAVESIKMGGFLGYLSFLSTAVERAIPSYTENFLSKTMRLRLKLADHAQLCVVALLGLTADLTTNDAVSRDGLDEDMNVLLRWQQSLAPAQGDKSPAPVLVFQGLNDTTVLPEQTKRAWNASCAAGNEVHVRFYTGQEHSPLVRAAQADWLGWMDNLFARGKNYEQTAESCRCTSFTRNPFDARYVKQPQEDTIIFLPDI